MSFEQAVRALDGLQVVFNCKEDIVMGVTALRQYFTHQQIERMAYLRGHKKIASVVRGMIRDEERLKKESANVSS